MCASSPPRTAATSLTWLTCCPVIICSAESPPSLGFSLAWWVGGWVGEEQQGRQSVWVRGQV
jgi:hypothetical protein